MSTPAPARPPPQPSTRLIAPGLALASCVRAYITRSTVEAPLARAADRFNHLPASPFCGITFFIEGEVEPVSPPAPPLTARVLFSGPQTRPLTSYNPGPVRLFMVLFYPQAMHALSGVDMHAWVDRWGALPEALDPAWCAMADAVLAAKDDQQRLALIGAFLAPRWRAARPGGKAAQAGDWVRQLAWQAADTALGRSLRSVERRIRVSAGQPLRKLLRLRRAEQVFFEARDDYLAGKVAWSEAAARGGYADQAHLCRESRETTGHSPGELARLLAGDDEPYWIYRIWV